MEITVNKVLDAKGLACPMPIVKTKKEMNSLDPGQIMEVQATDKGSTADMKAWAESTGHQYLGTIEDGDVLKHYLRRANEHEEKPTIKHPHIVKLDELLEKLDGQEKITILDVREQAEYAFGHIPGSLNIPLGELEQRFNEIESLDNLHIICRTGTRSDLAAQKLTEKGIREVKNVVPGMKEYTGELIKG
ncbi:sulfurtransferase TusA family protein [Metabacillus malikii]|uniref:Rhodanese-related sulfurtransferase/TusA-related sulfurtransferase n=1 Tax=Metabacillus malikii TaxID=1504265 RepID=A0ABT9ZEN5_9BACI|nr:sulfurtransferase TusA family protein [Metabacillus malikii]MDQ0230713.1 rhodanese-related sulfurtransferase/TusA-related sulfurtransferase [Metabacillus malikii]